MHDEEKRMTIIRYRTDAGSGGGNQRFAASRKRTGLVLVLCFCASSALGAQRPGAWDPKNPNLRSDESFERRVPLNQEARQQRLTPLGVQVPVVPELRKQHREGAVEPASEAFRGWEFEMEGDHRAATCGRRYGDGSYPSG